MKVRAIAIASPKSNLVGAVELSTTAEGLRITYLDAAHVGPDMVPVALERNSERLILWEQILDARLLGSALLLELDLGLGLVQRLVVVRFTFGQDQTPHELRQRRLLLRALVAGFMLMALVFAGLAGPRLAPTQGTFYGLGLGLVLVSIIALVGVLTDRFLVQGGHASALVREIFVGELLATLPRLPREPSRGLGGRRGIRLPPLDGLLPRTTVAIVITLTGAILAAVVMAKWVFFGDHTSASVQPTPRSVRRASPEPPAPRPPSPQSSLTHPSMTSGTLAAIATTPPPRGPQAAVPSPPGTLRPLGPCSCPRADSPLWREPVPVLTPVVLATRRFPHKNHEDVEVELAVVNNSNRPLGNISVLVEFFEADPGQITRLTSVDTRTVFFEGPLAAGKAIKWHVEERGTTFKIHPPTSNGAPMDHAIAPGGEDAAAASAFAELLAANNRPVRLHGAMMLAYLGDKRARAGIVDLGEALRDSEAPYLRRLLEATGDQISCQITLDNSNPATLRTCIFNRATAAIDNATVTVRLLDGIVSLKDPVGPAPQILGERTLPLATRLEPNSGQLVEGTVDWGDLASKPGSYEIVVQPGPE